MVLAMGAALGATRSVGPGKTYATPCAAIAAASPGDLIEVDAAGSYNGDHCNWTTDNLTVRGVNGRAKIDAGEDAANVQGNKGIFVIAAAHATLENFELSGAKISAANGGNGAGVRHQGTDLTLRNCFFHDNQDGILGSPATDGTGTVLIESSDFANNGAGDGQTHNMYLNHYAKFTLRYSHSTGANTGHLVKSRALENHVEYNRLTDERTNSSYELSFPNAGLSFVIGNIIEQSAVSQNSAIIDYGSEPATNNPDLRLFVVNNTVVNHRSAAIFVADHSATPALLMNNIFLGPGTVSSQANSVLTTNFTSSDGDPKLKDEAGYDYRLLPGSPCVDQGSDPGTVDGHPLTPTQQYVHPLQGEARPVSGALDIGAYELATASDGGVLDAGITDAGITDAGTTDAGTTDAGGVDAGGLPGVPEGGTGATPGEGGGCALGGGSVAGAIPAILLLAALLFRRRRSA